MNYMSPKRKCIIQVYLKLGSKLSSLKGTKTSSHFCTKSSPERISGYDDSDKIAQHRILYKSHVQTSAFQKFALTIGSSLTSILNPSRHDMIAVLGETTGHLALNRIYTIMIQNKEGFGIILDKPIINTSTIDLNYLAKLNENTLGFHYYTFLKINNVTPDSRMPVKFVDDAELAYVMQRYREVHDLVHTILGMPTNMQGEVAVKWVEALQTGLPMCFCGAIFGPLRFKKKQRKNYLNSYLEWALRVGHNAMPLMNIYFEKRWHQDISDLRKELNIEPFHKLHVF